MSDDREAIKDMLLADYAHFGESMWRNEEVGEKRFNFLLTLITAVAAGLVALGTSTLGTSEPKLKPEEFNQIAAAATGVVLVIGILSYLRMLRRNRVSDQYQRTLGYIRRVLADFYSDTMPEYRVPRPDRSRFWNKWLSGGYVETVAVLNGILVAALLELWLGTGYYPAVVAGVLVTALLWMVPPLVWPRVKNDEPESPTFRAGAGAVVTDAGGNVLLLERAGLPGAWQFPQGGLLPGEDPAAAVLRELGEETGLRPGDVEMVGAYPVPLAYVLPPKSRSAKTGLGQVHFWFLLRIREGRSPSLPAKGEFSRWEFRSFDNAVACAAEFRRPVYARLREWFGTLSAPTAVAQMPSR